jgi:hypothetical protein
LEALGFKDLPVAGTQMELQARAVMTHVMSADPDADGVIDSVRVELRLVELAIDQPQIAHTRNAVERREHSAARLYSMPEAPSNVASEEFGVLNSRYGK